MKNLVLILVAVLAVFQARCERLEFTVDGYTFIIVNDVDGEEAASIISVSDEALSEAKITGILDIPDSFTKDRVTYPVTEIQANVFYGKGLENVEELYLPEECLFLLQNNFGEMSNLRKVHFGDRINMILNDNFCNMPCLEEFDLPESFRNFNRGFLSNVGLKKIILPADYSASIYGATNGPTLCNLPNLEYLSLGNASYIDGAALYNIPLLPALTIPGACRSLDGKVIYNMAGLKSLRFAKRTISEFFIDPMAVNECPSLTDYYVEDAVPFEVDIRNGKNIAVPYSQCTLHVPAGAKEAYASAPFWSGFGTIVEDAAGVDAVEAEEDDGAAKWYSVDGREIDPSGFRGLALRRSGSKVTKHVLK